MNNAKPAYDYKKDKSLQDILLKANACLECGRCSGGCPMAYLFEHFNPRHLLEQLLDDPESVINSKDIWFCASCYTCRKNCPQALEMPELFHELRTIALQKHGSKTLQEALQVMQEKIPFTESFFKVCLHPDRLPINTEEIAPLPEHKSTIQTPKELDARIAIIGSGPVGLYACWLLRTRGYQVTLFEASEKPGGMLRRCIPNYRLQEETVDCDLHFLKNLNIDIRINTQIGKDLSFEELQHDEFKAIFIASGAHDSLPLHLEGEDYPEVMSSLEFLDGLKRDMINIKNEHIVIIGGGNTSMDSALAAKKHGAKEVIVLYRRSKEEMPANENEIEAAEKEGILFRYLESPVRFLGTGELEEVEIVKMQLGYPDLTGRRRPVPLENSNYCLKTDKAVVAIGDRPDTNYLPEEMQRNSDGTIAVNPIDMATNMAGVFAGGDAVLAAGTVSEGIVTACKAVEGIIKYVEKR